MILTVFVVLMGARFPRMRVNARASRRSSNRVAEPVIQPTETSQKYLSGGANALAPPQAGCP